MKNNTAQGERELMTNMLSQINKKTRLVEERIDNLRNHVDLLENNILEISKNNSKEFDTFNKNMRDLRKEMQENIEKFDRIAENITQLASKDTVKVIEKYIDLLNPMTLVTRDEVEELIDEKLRK
jgi:hypothetical protein